MVNDAKPTIFVIKVTERCPAELVEAHEPKYCLPSRHPDRSVNVEEFFLNGE